MSQDPKMKSTLAGMERTIPEEAWHHLTTPRHVETEFTVPLTETNTTEGCGSVYSNRFVSVSLIPSRFGPFTQSNQAPDPGPPSSWSGTGT